LLSEKHTNDVGKNAKLLNGLTRSGTAESSKFSSNRAMTSDIKSSIHKAASQKKLKKSLKKKNNKEEGTKSKFKLKPKKVDKAKKK
jgi:hypothetical protein